MLVSQRRQVRTEAWLTQELRSSSCCGGHTSPHLTSLPVRPTTNGSPDQPGHPCSAIRALQLWREHAALTLISHVSCFIVLGGIIPHLIVVVLFGCESTSLVIIWVSVAGRADEVMSSLNIVNNFFVSFCIFNRKR